MNSLLLFRELTDLTLFSAESYSNTGRFRWGEKESGNSVLIRSLDKSASYWKRSFKLAFQGGGGRTLGIFLLFFIAAIIACFSKSIAFYCFLWSICKLFVKSCRRDPLQTLYIGNQLNSLLRAVRGVLFRLWKGPFVAFVSKQLFAIAEVQVGADAGQNGRPAPLGGEAVGVSLWPRAALELLGELGSFMLLGF